MKNFSSGVRIVLGNGSLARYPQAGGHWTVRLQYLLGLRSLGHEITLLELFISNGDEQRDHAVVRGFFEALRPYGLEKNAVVIAFGKDCKEYDLRLATPFGRSATELSELVKNADLFWNDCCVVQQPLLGQFRHPVLIDLDPGHLQVSAEQGEIELSGHKSYLTVGLKMNDTDCRVPKLGYDWHTFRPFIHLPSWPRPEKAKPLSPFSSVTHWNWGELWYRDEVLSISKRDAYLRYIKLPQHARGPFQLAAQLHPADKTGDRELLEENGWMLVDPWDVASTPEAYQSYILGSRAEISCAKPVFRDLQTGWFSDRSVAYLASGRPVLAEETGYSDHLPTGLGIVPFHDLDGAVSGAAAIDENYVRHAAAARELAEAHFDAKICLQEMLAACY